MSKLKKNKISCEGVLKVIRQADVSHSELVMQKNRSGKSIVPCVIILIWTCVP